MYVMHNCSTFVSGKSSHFSIVFNTIFIPSHKSIRMSQDVDLGLRLVSFMDKVEFFYANAGIWIRIPVVRTQKQRIRGSISLFFDKVQLSTLVKIVTKLAMGRRTFCCLCFKNTRP